MSSSFPRDKYLGSGASPSQKAPPPKKRELRADFLLNFQRPPSHQRPQSSNYAPPPRRSRPTVRSRAPATFGKGRFVQSSFRLFVEDAAASDVVEAAFDADAMLDWNSVRRVDLICEQQPKCPICLELELCAPKITRCGHLFCFPCVMRYFLTLKDWNGKVYQRCPVCKEQVCPDELISARLEMASPLREGSLLNFVLAQKDVGSTLVRLAGQDADQGELPRLPCQRDPGFRLSRVILLSPEEAARIAEQELEELLRYREQALELGDTELLPSATTARELLEKQIKERSANGPAFRSRLSSAGTESLPEQEEEDMLPQPAVALGEADDAEDADIADSFSPASSPNQSPTQSPSNAVLRSPAGAAMRSPGMAPTSRGISFYQTVDGRLVYLQPFFTKLLLHDRGGWDRLPFELTELRLERIHEETVSEETRKRHKFLSHLPLGSSISFVEVDLRAYLSRETKEHFAEDFAKRRQQRKKDQIRSRKEEQKSKARAAEDEERFYNSLNLAPTVVQALPTKEDFAVPLPGREDDSAETGLAVADEDDAPTLADKIKGKMAAKEAKKQLEREQRDYFPELAGGVASSASAWGPGLGSSKAWGRKDAADAKAPGGQAKSAAEPVSSWEELVTPMEEQPSFGAALEAALKRSSGSEPSASASQASGPAEDNGKDEVPGAAGKKKKGKAKPTTIRLFG